MQEKPATSNAPSFQYLQDLIAEGPIDGGGADPISYHVIQLLLEYQNTSELFGDLVEIGVFRGHTFTLLAAASLNTQNTIGIDIEERCLKASSALAKDKCREYGVAPQIHAIQGSSTNRNMKEILNTAVGGNGIRFAHIDGEHSRELALSDARMLESAMAPYGLICFDDCFSILCPGVTQAFFQFASETEWQPLLFTPNKAYLCHRRYITQYRKFIMSIPEDLETSRSIITSMSSSSYYPGDGFISIFNANQRFYQVVNKRSPSYEEYMSSAPVKLDSTSCRYLDFDS